MSRQGKIGKNRNAFGSWGGVWPDRSTIIDKAEKKLLMLFEKTGGGSWSYIRMKIGIGGGKNIGKLLGRGGCWEGGHMGYLCSEELPANLSCTLNKLFGGEKLGGKCPYSWGRALKGLCKALKKIKKKTSRNHEMYNCVLTPVFHLDKKRKGKRIYGGCAKETGDGSWEIDKKKKKSKGEKNRSGTRENKAEI